MKNIITLSLAALLATAAMPAFANPGDELQAPGQPFVHPTTDQSYSQNITDDRIVANDPYDYENAVVPSSRVREDERVTADNSDNADHYYREHRGDYSTRPGSTTSSLSDPDDTDNVARPEDNGRAKYVSGGVADSGMQAMDMKQNGYNLKTLFVRGPKGEYLANVHVTVTGRDGEVLQTNTRGPELLANVPPGSYTVTAQTEGGDQTLTQHIKVGRDHLSSYTFRFQTVEASQE